MPGTRALLRLTLLASLVPLMAAAQESTPPQEPADAGPVSCAFAPSPDCHLFGITEVDFTVGPGSGHGGERWRGLVGEWTISGGMMTNLTPRDAVGGFWFVDFGPGGNTTGPAARYRRWLGPRRSLDVGGGVTVRGSADRAAGSVIGHVRYNPLPWLGAVVRPELIRRVPFECVGGTCAARTERDARVMIGADVAGLPAFTGLTATVGVLMLVALIAFSIQEL